MKSTAELTALFRAAGRKVTPQRERIFRALEIAETHPSAEAVYEEVRADMPTISLRTVYQTLNDLAAMGEIQHLELGTGSARFDPNVEPHHHLVCERCGEVVDVYGDFSNVHVPEGAPEGFVVRATEIVFRGRCARCTDAPAASQPGGAGEISSLHDPSQQSQQEAITHA